MMLNLLRRKGQVRSQKGSAARSKKSDIARAQESPVTPVTTQTTFVTVQ